MTVPLPAGARQPAACGRASNVRRAAREAPRTPRTDAGSVSVLVVAIMCCIGVCALTAGAAVGITVHRAEARAGADLAALAGAVAARARAGEGPATSACAAAELAARANGVVMTSCVTARNGSVQVGVRSRVATARARAGPIWADENPTKGRAYGSSEVDPQIHVVDAARRLT